MVILKTFRQPKFGSFDHLIEDLKEYHDINESGVSSILSALRSHRDYITILFDDNKKLLGAIAYSVSDKLSFIEINHIGILNQGNGYGTILMEKVFKTAYRLNKSVSLMANGSSNQFYEKLGMHDIGKRPIAIYELSNYEINKRYCI